MGLCLCVFDADFDDDDTDPEEIAACDVGAYSDFGYFRESIARLLDPGAYPTLMEHPDCDGEWLLAEIPQLEQELREIGDAFRQLPPEEPVKAFEHAAEYRVGASSYYDCFHDVNGQNLFESILSLCEVAREHGRPITFA